MDELVFLVHRIPYPPNKGDKIRSFNLLRYLSRDYRVHLGAFVDDEDDWQHAETLQRWCADVHLETLSPTVNKLRSLTGLLSGEALGLPYYRNKAMQEWVRDKIFHERIGRVVVFSSTMAQYVSGTEFKDIHRILDMVDVDSEKWRAYAELKCWPVSWLYRREGERLLDFERERRRRIRQNHIRQRGRGGCVQDTSAGISK